MALSKMFRKWLFKPLIDNVNQLSRTMDMNREELASQLSGLASTLNGLNATVTKIGAETQSLLDAVAELTTAVENAGNTTPEIDAALLAVQEQGTALAAALQSVDDKVPDAG